MHEEPLLYVAHLQTESVFVEDESTSVFARVPASTLVMRQLQFFAKQQRDVTLVLVNGERLSGTIVRIEDEKLLLATETTTMWVAFNAIRVVR